MGQVSHAEAMALYSRAQIAVVPSLWQEPFSRSAIEALASGCALIATRTGGLAEVAADVAEIVDASDIAAFAAALRRVATDEPLRARLQQQGRAKAREVFEIRARDGGPRRGPCAAVGRALNQAPLFAGARHVSHAPNRRGIAQPGSAEVLGTSGRRFESCCPDQTK